MYTIKVHNHINKIISLYYFFGLWRNNDGSRYHKWMFNIWHLAVCGCYTILLALGALTTKSEVEAVFLGVVSIGIFVNCVRMYYLLLNKEQIVKYLNEMGNQSTNDFNEFNQINQKIKLFMKFVVFFEVMTVCTIVALTILALSKVSSDRQLPFNIYIPFDWKNSHIAYWIIFVLNLYALIIVVLGGFFSGIIWYLMLSFVTKYRILGNTFSNIGFTRGAETTCNRKIVSIIGEQDLFPQELIALIKIHQQLQKTTNHFKMFFSNLFLIQLATSALAICGSVYALAFNSFENPLKYGAYVTGVLYTVFDIFMITYFGNEIKYLSGLLPHRLFECNWMDQSKSCKKSVFILMEVLKRPQELVIGKIYPLDLLIFTKILKGAYSMFNILQRLK